MPLPHSSTTRHLFVNGDLIIRGTINLPRLEAVFVTGRVIVEPNAVFTGHPDGTVFILSGGPNNPNVVDPEFTFIPDMSRRLVIEGTDTSVTTLNNAIFYVASRDASTHSIVVEATLRGNAVFYAGGSVAFDFKGSTGRQVGTVQAAPQFYARGSLLMSGDSSPSLYGVYANANPGRRLHGTNIARFGGLVIGDLNMIMIHVDGRLQPTALQTGAPHGTGLATRIQDSMFSAQRRNASYTYGGRTQDIDAVGNPLPDVASGLFRERIGTVGPGDGSFEHNLPESNSLFFIQLPILFPADVPGAPPRPTKLVIGTEGGGTWSTQQSTGARFLHVDQQQPSSPSRIPRFSAKIIDQFGNEITDLVGYRIEWELINVNHPDSGISIGTSSDGYSFSVQLPLSNRRLNVDKFAFGSSRPKLVATLVEVKDSPGSEVFTDLKDSINLLIEPTKMSPLTASRSTAISPSYGMNTMGNNDSIKITAALTNIGRTPGLASEIGTRPGNHAWDWTVTEVLSPTGTRLPASLANAISIVPGSDRSVATLTVPDINLPNNTKITVRTVINPSLYPAQFTNFHSNISNAMSQELTIRVIGGSAFVPPKPDKIVIERFLMYDDEDGLSVPLGISPKSVGEINMREGIVRTVGTYFKATVWDKDGIPLDDVYLDTLSWDVTGTQVTHQTVAPGIIRVTASDSAPTGEVVVKATTSLVNESGVPVAATAPLEVINLVLSVTPTTVYIKPNEFRELTASLNATELLPGGYSVSWKLTNEFGAEGVGIASIFDIEPLGISRTKANLHAPEENSFPGEKLIVHATLDSHTNVGSAVEVTVHVEISAQPLVFESPRFHSISGFAQR
jgi:hypothetical protein